MPVDPGTMIEQLQTLAPSENADLARRAFGERELSSLATVRPDAGER